MGWTTGRTLAQTAAALVTVGAMTDQAAQALHSAAYYPGKLTSLWGVLVQCTSGWNSGDPVFEYDTNPGFAQTGKTLAQTAAALVTAGALTDQATAVLHTLAWKPGTVLPLWGVLVQCTSGWNSGDPVFKYATSPS